MSSPLPNPRRCYKTKALPASTSCQPSSTHHARLPHGRLDTNLPLKKSSTFHSPTPPPTDDDPIVSIPLLSRRSPTSPKELEDAVVAGELRVADLLSHVDRSLSGLESFTPDSQKTLGPDDLPVPRFMLDAHVDDSDHMDVDKTEDTKLLQRRKHHSSDSGIGSTVTASEDLDHDEQGKCRRALLSLLDAYKTHTPTGLDGYKNSIPSLIKEIQSGINGNGSVGAGLQHALSAYACRQIQKYIIVPILKEQSLKSFHPLVKGIPIRVGRKEITCLRDLEKVLLWLAPVSDSLQAWERSLASDFGFAFQRFSASRASFVKFGETTIQCLHTAVSHLSEPDLRRPADRPYTNGYFLDLTEQVRQYAAMITVARERMAAGQTREGDATRYASMSHAAVNPVLTSASDERLVLHGGISQNGRPAELARSKDGKLISLATGEIIDTDADSPIQKSFATQAERDDYELSMARRRKNAPEKVSQRCSECDKEFKRPCDLTKHEKTHSRPWKCNEPTCKYSHYGWPTEKERDRHVNDKHSVTPSMFKCQYHPCPYESKRDSNCKQHMEKAHGWAYVRSKNNGKTTRKSISNVSSKSPPTPQATPGSNSRDFSGSEYEPESPYARTHSRATSTTSNSITDLSPYMPMENNFNTPFDTGFNWDEASRRLTPVSPYTPGTAGFSMGSGSLGTAPTLPSSSYGTSMEEIDPPLFNGTFDWSNMDMNTDFTSMNVQLFTPAPSTETRPLDQYSNSRNPSVSLDQPIAHPNLSPGAEGSAMLYSPSEQPFAMDETFDEFSGMGKPTGDFALFDSEPSHGAGGNVSLFGDMPGFYPSTWHTMPGNSQSLGMDDPMTMEH